MDITELTKELAQVMERFGEMDVVVQAGNGELYPIRKVNFLIVGKVVSIVI